MQPDILENILGRKRKVLFVILYPILYPSHIWLKFTWTIRAMILMRLVHDIAKLSEDAVSGRIQIPFKTYIISRLFFSPTDNISDRMHIYPPGRSLARIVAANRKCKDTSFVLKRIPFKWPCYGAFSERVHRWSNFYNAKLRTYL